MPNKGDVYIRALLYIIFIIMETSDTKWNKKFRRDRIPSDQNIENMDTMGLEEKIKSLLKQKIYRENIKNIELLKSIYEEKDSEIEEEDDEDAKEKKEKKGGSKGKNAKNESDTQHETFVSNSGNSDQSKSKCGGGSSSSSSSSNINVESFASIQNDPNVKMANKYINIILDQVFSFVTSIPMKIDDQINYVSHILVETFSKMDKPSPNEDIKKNDKKVIRETLYLFVLFPVAIYITYNLYFITALKDTNFDTVNENRVPTRPATDEKRIKFKVDGWKNEEIWEYFLHYVLKPIDQFDSLFLGDGIPVPKNPYLASIPGLPVIFNILDSKLSFFILLLLSLFLVMSPSLSILSLLKSIQSGIPTGIHYFFLAIKIPMFIMASIKIGTSYFSKIPPSVPSILFFMGLVLGSLIIAFYSNKISILVLLIFIWLHCFFGMVMYGNDSILKRIYYGIKYVNLDLNKNNESSINSNSIFEKIARFIKKYSVVLAFDIILIVVFITTAFKLKSPVFSTAYKSFLAALIGLITIYMLLGEHQSGKMKHKISPDTTPLGPMSPVVPITQPIEPDVYKS
jgi:hypothetical protein